MSMTDSISDMIVRIKNAQNALLVSVEVPYSVQKANILNVLKEEGYIKDYFIRKIRKDIQSIDVELKYSKSGKPAIQFIKRVSTPGRRFYTSCESFKTFFNGMGIYILSTSKGIFSDREARRERVGGEVICKVF
jgi:small subunit ribosomal protein S8